MNISKYIPAPACLHLKMRRCFHIHLRTSAVEYGDKVGDEVGDVGGKDGRDGEDGGEDEDEDEDDEDHDDKENDDDDDDHDHDHGDDEALYQQRMTDDDLETVYGQQRFGRNPS